MNIYVFKVTDNLGFSGECAFFAKYKRDAEKAVKTYIKQWCLESAKYECIKVEYDVSLEELKKRGMTHDR